MKHFSKFFSIEQNTEKKSSTDNTTDIDKELSNISTFIRSGLVVLSILLLSGIAIGYARNATETTTTGNNRISNKKLPIYCVDQKEKKVALSFDAAWGNEDTKKILSILKKKKVHVTFFMTGGWIEKYPDDVKAIQKAGHELGNHSENHKQMSYFCFWLFTIKKGSNTLLARILPPFHTSNTAYSLIEALLHSPQSIFILYS